MTDVRSRTTIRAGDARGLDELRARVRGAVYCEDDVDYDVVRRVYNGMIDKRPSLVVQCRDVADVMAAVKHAVDRDLPIAVRGGAHNVAGFGTCDDGVVIDLSPMKSVRYDSVTHRVRVDGGCTWGDVDHATHAVGRAVPGGVVSTTGVGGLTLGGGFGHLTRHYGLTCDNLVSADVVTAEGALVTANEKENEDLFWALRGGGGNFGVVTSFEFRSHPVHTVYAGPIIWRYDRSAEMMRVYRDVMEDAPEELNALAMFVRVPSGPPFPAELHDEIVCGVLVCYSGRIGDGEKAVRPLREWSPPAFDRVGQVPFPAFQSALDAIAPAGLQNYWKSDFVETISDGLIAAHMRHASGMPTAQSGVHTFPLNGAVRRVGKDETAYSYRDAAYTHNIHAAYPDPADTPRIRDWVRAYWEDLHTYSAGGAYVNFLMEEGDERIAASYRENFPRLQEIKAKYDPRNRFRVNQNIPPRV